MLYPKRLPFLSLLFLACITACSPKVSLTASPPVIAKGDSVLLHWKVSGRPTMMVDTKKIGRPPFDSAEVMEFTLNAKKGKKEKYVKRQVLILPAGAYDQLAFVVSGINGDTLVSGGIKDTTAWNNYRIITLASVSKRQLIVSHAGKTGLVSDTTASRSWNGLPYAGSWKIKSLLTPEEKVNHSKIPNVLIIKAFVKPSNYADVQPQ